MGVLRRLFYDATVRVAPCELGEPSSRVQATSVRTSPTTPATDPTESNGSAVALFTVQSLREWCISKVGTGTAQTLATSGDGYSVSIEHNKFPTRRSADFPPKK